MRRIAILDAPSNLGLRPPTATSVPGCAKAPGALRDHGLLHRLHARDAGCLTPPRYDPGEWRPGDGVCHATEIAAYSRKLADRIGAIIDAGEFPVILGGDCSIVLGSGLAMHRLGEDIGGRIGLVFVDGHSDFRHPGNASYVGAAAGEDLALVTGRGQADLAAIEGRRPYFRDIDVVVMGIRAQDEYRLDLQAAGIVTRPVPTLRAEGAARSAQWARDQLVDCAGFWVHVDVDVLDPAVMPAVDAPSPGGIAFPELELLLAGLVESPHCLGVEITVYDPDYDADGGYAEEITSTVVAGLLPARTVAPRPDLIAARSDLSARTDEPQRRPHPHPAPSHPEPAPSHLQPGTAGSKATSHPVTAGSDGTSQGGQTAPPPTAPQPAEPHDGEFEPVASGTGEPERDPIEERRAAAAAASVTLAAAGVSDGNTLPGTPGESAIPAVTMHAVEEADEVDAFPDEFDPASYHPDSQPAGHRSDGADDAESADKPDETADRAGRADAEPADRTAGPEGADDQTAGRPIKPRPLGAAPLLDSEPLPATRPGMLRPRPPEPGRPPEGGGGFSLPAQRPAFDLGPEEPADIA